MITFQSTRPAWGATLTEAAAQTAQKISIHAPRVGRDMIAMMLPSLPDQFQSTRPAWGATCPMQAGRGSDGISIHAPRVGRDSVLSHQREQLRISIHAPRVGRDTVSITTRQAIRTFQSTRPAWGATQSPAPDREHRMRFQSTRPAWGATMVGGVVPRNRTISIHAPRVGRDVRQRRGFRARNNFNPRAPRGARLGSVSALRSGLQFQSTRPAWGATVLLWMVGGVVANFNPRAPRGARRRVADVPAVSIVEFQSTRPAWGATR